MFHVSTVNSSSRTNGLETRSCRESRVYVFVLASVSVFVCDVYVYACVSALCGPPRSRFASFPCARLHSHSDTCDAARCSRFYVFSLLFFLSIVFSCSFSSFAPRSQSFGDRPAIERVRRVFEAPCEFPGVISFYLTLQILPNILRTGSTVFTHRVFVETHTFHSLFSLLTSLSLSPSYTSLLVLTALARRRVRCISRLVLRREGVARRRCRASSFLVYLSSFAKGRREPLSLLL